jgi:2-polyprenyl-6-methoxyphenol hydroxylase-like FAD-dependent oxidoreductase
MKFERFEQQADGTVKAWFADGSSDTADVLVGADGIGSRIRRQYLPRVKVVDTGIRMLMGATPLHAIVDTGLPDLIRGATAVKINGKMQMALNIMRFSQSPAAARHQWLPALSSPAVTDAEDYIMWAMPTSKVGSAESPEGVWRVAQMRAAERHPTLGQIVDAAWPELTSPLRIGVIPPMAAWPASPVTLIGDAIHVAPGVGGNLAMQDAHHLCDALIRAAGGKQDLRAAIGAYEDTMRRDNFPAPFTFRWVMMRYVTRFVSPLARRRMG